MRTDTTAARSAVIVPRWSVGTVSPWGPNAAVRDGEPESAHASPHQFFGDLVSHPHTHRRIFGGSLLQVRSFRDLCVDTRYAKRQHIDFTEIRPRGLPSSSGVFRLLFALYS